MACLEDDIEFLFRPADEGEDFAGASAVNAEVERHIAENKDLRAALAARDETIKRLTADLAASEARRIADFVASDDQVKHLSYQIRELSNENKFLKRKRDEWTL